VLFAAPGRFWRRKRGSRARCRASRCPIGMGNRVTSPKRRSMLSSIKSQMPPLLMPPVVATQEIASQSQHSRVKAIRTRSPSSQPISNPSEHHRRCALFASLSSVQRMNAPIAVGRLPDDGGLDLGQQLVFRLGPSANGVAGLCSLASARRGSSAPPLASEQRASRDILASRQGRPHQPFFTCAGSSASRRTSVFLPNSRCNSRA